MGIIARRTMNYSYPIIDTVFLVFFCALLIFNKKYRALIWGLIGGVIYFLVDYGIFHLLTHSRSIENANLFWVLLWMSMSYGLTNFVWIWLWFEKDEHFWGYSAVIFFWWIVCPMISEMFTAAPIFTIERTTGSYHGVMGLILFVSYAAVLIYNMRVPKERRANILWMLAIGIMVQLGWEFSLLVSGIRSGGMTGFEMFKTLAVNSLVETNLGIPSMYLIFVYATRFLDKRQMLTGLNKNRLLVQNGAEKEAQAGNVFTDEGENEPVLYSK